MKAALLAYLKRLKANGPDHPQVGLCLNVELAVSDDCAAEFLPACFELMGLDRDYPVSGGGIAYARAQYESRMWDYSTDYGQARWKLVDDLIEFLERGQ